MSVSQADYAAMEKLYEDAHKKALESQAQMEAVDLRLAGIESGLERVLADLEKRQVCRDCGETFPFDPDADRCEKCAPRDEAVE
jgi:ribosomal protein L40E